MLKSKKIVFLTGTRADFGKLKSLIRVVQESNKYEAHIFVTGMHLNALYGLTGGEIEKSGFKNIYKFINHDSIDNMDRTLAKTIDGFSHYVGQIKPDLIVVHGDRVEAMSGAIVGSLNNILVAHIEGGEVSGTIDELIRHAVSKMSHIHLVANQQAKNRLIQLGELNESIFVLGSPDLDLMNPKTLPSIDIVKDYYDIDYDRYAIAMLHPVTTEYQDAQKNARSFVDALIENGENYVVIYPNNDLGSNEILREYQRLEGNNKFKVYPSLRFEYFLTLLKNADYIVGNSSSGIREAYYYNTPTIDIGSRQKNRAISKCITHCDNDKNSITRAIEKVKKSTRCKSGADIDFGKGNSDEIFLRLLDQDLVWSVQHQKQFQDLSYEQN